MPVCFVTRDRNGVDLNGRENGEEVGGEGAGESVIIICCMKKRLFSVREDNLNCKNKKQFKRKETETRRDNSVIKGAGCIFRGPEFNSQHAQSTSCLFVTDPEDPPPSHRYTGKHQCT